LALCLALACAIANAIVSYLLPQDAIIPETYILEAIAISALPVLIYFNHTRTRSASTVFLLLWPLYLAVQVIWTRTAVVSGLPHLPIDLALRWAIVTLGACAYFIERWGPEYGEPPRQPSGSLHPENPLLTADIFTVWYFSWLSPIMQKGAKQPITEADLPELLERDESTLLGERLECAMKKRFVLIPLISSIFVLKSVPCSKSLSLALMSAYGGPYAFAAFLKIIQDCLNYAQPQLLRLFLAYIAAYQGSRNEGKDGGPSVIEGFSIVAIMFIAAIVQSIIMHQVCPSIVSAIYELLTVMVSISKDAMRQECVSGQGLYL